MNPASKLHNPLLTAFLVWVKVRPQVDLNPCTDHSQFTSARLQRLF
jgi:hypothetical protein